MLGKIATISCNIILLFDSTFCLGFRSSSCNCIFYFQVPATVTEWKKVAEGFWNRWDFPNCIGCLDGKHVLIRPPPNTGSAYYNYKHTFSVVLLALVDHNYKFLYVDVGCNGRISDG